MLQLMRTDSAHSDFAQLIIDLDAELAISDGEEHDFYHQFSGVEDIKHVVLAYIDNVAVGCGAIKKFDSDHMEVKRMYISPPFRGHAYALQVLNNLENWSKTLGYLSCILETGTQQPEAIRLYTKANYKIIDNYAQYAGLEGSICFKKTL